MPDTIDRIRTTHVGSLVRPPKLVEFLRKIEDSQPYDKAAYEACLKESIEEVVRQQVEAGIDIVSDGEFSKGRNWAFYVHDRLTGVAARPLTPEEAKDPLASAGGGQDRVAFPEFYAEYEGTHGEQTVSHGANMARMAPNRETRSRLQRLPPVEYWTGGIQPGLVDDELESGRLHGRQVG